MSMRSLTLELLGSVCRNHAVAAFYAFDVHATMSLPPADRFDYGVLFDVPPPPDIRIPPTRLATALATIFGRNVRVLVLDRAPPDLVHELLKDAGLYVNRNPSRRVAFEEETREAVRRAGLSP